MWYAFVPFVFSFYLPYSSLCLSFCWLVLVRLGLLASLLPLHGRICDDIDDVTEFSMETSPKNSYVRNPKQIALSPSLSFLFQFLFFPVLFLVGLGSFHHVDVTFFLPFEKRKDHRVLSTSVLPVKLHKEDHRVKVWSFSFSYRIQEQRRRMFHQILRKRWQGGKFSQNLTDD